MGPAAATPALRAATAAGVPVTVHRFRHDPGVRGFGEEAVAALGVPAARVFKTLLAEVEGGHAVAVLPVPARLDLRALAVALGVRRAAMADPAEAERVTGYVRGGMSPLGQRRALPAVVDESALTHGTILVSAGRRGMQMEIAPEALIALTGARTARIAGAPA